MHTESAPDATDPSHSNVGADSSNGKALQMDRRISLDEINAALLGNRGQLIAFVMMKGGEVEAALVGELTGEQATADPGRALIQLPTAEWVQSRHDGFAVTLKGSMAIPLQNDGKLVRRGRPVGDLDELFFRSTSDLLLVGNTNVLYWLNRQKDGILDIGFVREMNELQAAQGGLVQVMLGSFQQAVAGRAGDLVYLEFSLGGDPALQVMGVLGSDPLQCVEDDNFGLLLAIPTIREWAAVIQGKRGASTHTRSLCVPLFGSSAILQNPEESKAYVDALGLGEPDAGSLMIVGFGAIREYFFALGDETEKENFFWMQVELKMRGHVFGPQDPDHPEYIGPVSAG